MPAAMASRVFLSLPRPSTLARSTSPRRIEEFALAHERARDRAGSGGGASKRGEIDVRGHVGFARCGQRVVIFVGAHRLQRVAGARLGAAVVDDQRRAAFALQAARRSAVIAALPAGEASTMAPSGKGTPAGRCSTGVRPNVSPPSAERPIMRSVHCLSVHWNWRIGQGVEEFVGDEDRRPLRDVLDGAVPLHGLFDGASVAFWISRSRGLISTR